MKISASAGRSKKNFDEHCQKLTLTATDDGEAKFLGFISRVWLDGGVIIVDVGPTRARYEYPMEKK